MKAHHNYKYFQQFRNKVDGAMLDDWLYVKGYSTQTIWNRYNLERIPEDQLATNAKFKTYYRYASKYDDAIHSPKNIVFQPPICYGGTPGELNVKVRMWAEKGRPRWHVRKMLGLDNVSKSVVNANPY